MNLIKIKNMVILFRIYLLIIACAGFHTMLILSVITYFLEVNYIVLRVIGGLCFVGLSVCFLIVFPEKLQEALYGKKQKPFRCD